MGRTKKKKARQWFISHLDSAVSLSQAVAHEAGKQRQHHLWVHLHQVVRQGVDPGPDLAGQGDGIPGREPRWTELSHRNNRASGKHRQRRCLISYLALSILSSSIIMPLSTCFTSSHLTAPGAMESIKSKTGRLVLISGSCTDRRRANKSDKM